MHINWRHKMALLGLNATLVACSSTSFGSSGGSDSKPTGSNALASSDQAAPAGGSSAGSGAQAAAAVAPGADNSCSASGVTKVTMLSKTVGNGVTGNYVDYRLSLMDCAGNHLPFTASTLGFDIGASISAEADLTYTITDIGNTANHVSGTLLDIEGDDLFGNIGVNFYHYETDKRISFAAAANAIIVHIDLGGLAMVPYNHPTSLEMNTYLAFGKAATATVPVTLSTAATMLEVLAGAL